MTNQQQENQVKFHAKSKWNSLILNWPGHVIFDTYEDANGLWKALKRHGFTPQGDWLKDGRYKLWRVK